MGSRASHETVSASASGSDTNGSLYGFSLAHVDGLNPMKRRRVSLPHIDVTQAVIQDTRDVLSADPRRGSGQACVRVSGSREAVSDSHIATPRRVRRGKKNGLMVSEPQGAQFIQEAFSFPERQIWLKTKPRHRKAAVVQEAASPLKETPSEGETLSLAKHADQIAALIAQKRLENESRSFRERMVLQQRIYRGEEDVKDKLIAAGHDELKRKMELSARGIFEEKPPGEARVRRVTSISNAGSTDISEQPTSPSEVDSLSAAEQDDHQVREGANTGQVLAASEVVSASNTHRVSERSSIEIDSTDVGLPPDSESHSLMPPPMIFHQVQHNTTESITLTTTAAYPQPSGHYMAQSRFSNQRVYDTQLQPPDQFAAVQDWTTHMWHALPSTATPVLARSTVVLPSAHTPQSSVSIDRAGRVPTAEESASTLQQRENFGLLSVGANGSSVSAFSRVNDASSTPALSTEASQSDQTPAITKSNTNMFTGKAREDMLIGNSNHHAEPEKRRNMFSNRS